MKITDIAYIAGLVDGEGYIGIKKTKAYKSQDRKTPSYHARIQIRMVDEPAIRFISECLGGSYYKEKQHSIKTRRPLYCYQASDKCAENILTTIIPFLLVKKVSAQTVLELRKLQTKRRQYQTKPSGTRRFPTIYCPDRKIQSYCLSDEYVAMCDKLYLKCKSLNHGGL